MKKELAIKKLSEWIDVDVISEALYENLASALDRKPTFKECQELWFDILEDFWEHAKWFAKR